MSSDVVGADELPLCARRVCACNSGFDGRLILRRRARGGSVLPCRECSAVVFPCSACQSLTLERGDANEYSECVRCGALTVHSPRLRRRMLFADGAMVAPPNRCVQRRRPRTVRCR